MGSDVVTRFRLSVWRPAQLGRPLDYAGHDVAATPGFDTTRLLEEIYHWHPGEEDVWGCIQDPAMASEIRNLFIEGFAPSLAPEDRLCRHFGRPWKNCVSVLGHPNASSWADSPQVVRTGRDESANIRANSTISLVHHMEWIVRTFGNVPRRTVTIR